MELLSKLNRIKQTYTEKQKYLQELKSLITNANNTPGILDQASRSKARIQIESLLIDLNEELFAISEEMAKVFQFDKSSSNNLGARVNDFETRKK